MHAERQASKALTFLSATRGELESAKARITALGLATPGHSVDLYTRLLGPPLDVTTFHSLSETGVFANSLGLRFHLPLWPELDFIVNQTTEGMAWGWTFVRSRGSQPPVITSLRDLTLWSLVVGDFKQFEPLEREDAWNHWESRWLMIPLSPGGPVRRCLVEFDFELLQKIHDPEDA